MRFCSEEAHNYTDVRPQHHVWPAVAHMAPVEHHKVGALDNIWSCTALIILPQINDVQGHNQASHLLNKKQAPVTTRSSNLRCVPAAEHYIAKQYSKTGRTKPRKHLPRATYHEILARTFSRYQGSEKLLWKLSEDASQKSSCNQMSLPKYPGGTVLINYKYIIYNGLNIAAYSYVVT